MNATATVVADDSETGPSVDRDLPCQLTPDELAARGDSMADAELKITKIKDERRNLNRVIRELAERRAELAGIIESKTEPRPTRCTWHRNNADLTWILVRDDTGEVIETRPQTTHERQVDLFSDGERDEGDSGPGPEALPPVDDDPTDPPDGLDGDDDYRVDDDAVDVKPKRRKPRVAGKGKGKSKRGRR